MQREAQIGVKLNRAEWADLVAGEIARATGLEPKEYFEQVDAGKIDCSYVAEPSSKNDA